MTDKMPCSVIEDLIPLYKENLCSDESRALVEEHFAECECCRAFAENVELPAVAGLSDTDEQKPFRKVNKKLKSSRLKVIILSALLAVVVLPLAFLTAGQMFRWEGAISFETIVQNFEAQRIANAFANGDIDLFADYLAYEAVDADKSFWDNYDEIVEKDKQNLKELYNKAFKGLTLDKVSVRTSYAYGGTPASTLKFDFTDHAYIDDWQGVGIGFCLNKTDYGKYTGYINTIGYSSVYGLYDEGKDGYPDNAFGDFIRCYNLTKHHDINEYNELERFIASSDPLGEYISGGYAVSGKDGTYEEGEYTYSPKITYLARYFAPADRDYIVQSMVEFYQKGNRIANCSVSDPCYDPERTMLYYNIVITAVGADDSSSHAVLQARMFYDYTGIYQPEVYSVAPGGCSAELLSDLRNFFGCEPDTPVLSSKTDDLTEAKKLLDDNGIRCKIAVGTNVGTGEQEYNLLTSFDDAAKASGIMMSSYGDNSRYECYTY